MYFVLLPAVAAAPPSRAFCSLLLGTLVLTCQEKLPEIGRQIFADSPPLRESSCSLPSVQRRINSSRRNCLFLDRFVVIHSTCNRLLEIRTCSYILNTAIYTKVSENFSKSHEPYERNTIISIIPVFETNLETHIKITSYFSQS